MSLNKEFEMARREAVTFLSKEDQKREIRKRLDNGKTWIVNLKETQMKRDQLLKRFKVRNKNAYNIWLMKINNSLSQKSFKPVL